MSEDRLEKALEAIKNEPVDPGQLEEARGRVWAKMGMPSTAACAEFESEIGDYLEGKLGDNRRLLMEDHLGRCAACRARMAEQKGERRPIPIQSRRAVRMPRWGAWAAAAALLLAALYVGRNGIYSFMTQNSPRATVVSSTGELYLVPDELLKAGAAIAENAVVRTGLGAKARLRLSDGSLMDMNEGTELSIHAALSGKTILLQRGDIIVHAAKQRLGHLRVQTRDSVASVKGTIFAVSAGISGSLVSVVEGSVAVTQPGGEVLLSPGEQAASNPALIQSVQSAIAWSPDAESYIALLASFINVEKQMANAPSPSLAAQSRLLQYMPGNTVLYGALPNLGGVANQAVLLFEQQSAENPVFNQWWYSSASQGLKQMLGSMQTFMPLLGDELVYGIAMNVASPGDAAPLFLAEPKAGKQPDLAANLEGLRARMGSKSFHYSLNDTMLVISDSQTHLQWLLAHMGEGAATPFAGAIAAKYQAGVDSLLGIDISTIFSFVRNPATRIINSQQLKHIFIQQRTIQGAEENEMTLSFQGPRTGIGSFLASTGSGGAAEYISRDAIAAIYASTREPEQMAKELIALFSRSDPSFQTNLALAESKLGISFADDFARAFGAESALAIEGISTSGPVWAMAEIVNDQLLLEKTIRKLIDVMNAELARAGKSGRIQIGTENIDGRTWTTMKLPDSPLAITWTYDRGYMIAGSDRGAAARALATRNGGSPLVFSAAFQQQLPSLAGLHPSGFVWVDAKSALKNLPAPMPNPAIQRLIAEGDPILVTFSATTEQIRIISRTRISGMMMNLLLLQGASRTSSSGGNAAVR